MSLNVWCTCAVAFALVDILRSAFYLAACETIANHFRVMGKLKAARPNMIHTYESVGGNKGVSMRLGCRRGGSRLKATAVVLYFGLISPKQRQRFCQEIVNFYTIKRIKFSCFPLVELVVRLWNDRVC